MAARSSVIGTVESGAEPVPNESISTGTSGRRAKSMVNEAQVGRTSSSRASSSRARSMVNEKSLSRTSGSEKDALDDEASAPRHSGQRKESNARETSPTGTGSNRAESTHSRASVTQTSGSRKGSLANETSAGGTGGMASDSMHRHSGSITHTSGSRKGSLANEVSAGGSGGIESEPMHHHRASVRHTSGSRKGSLANEGGTVGFESEPMHHLHRESVTRTSGSRKGTLAHEPSEFVTGDIAIESTPDRASLTRDSGIRKGSLVHESSAFGTAGTVAESMPHRASVTQTSGSRKGSLVKEPSVFVTGDIAVESIPDQASVTRASGGRKETLADTSMSGSGGSRAGSTHNRASVTQTSGSRKGSLANEPSAFVTGGVATESVPEQASVTRASGGRKDESPVAASAGSKEIGLDISQEDKRQTIDLNDEMYRLSSDLIAPEDEVEVEQAMIQDLHEMETFLGRLVKMRTEGVIGAEEPDERLSPSVKSIVSGENRHEVAADKESVISEKATKEVPTENIDKDIAKMETLLKQMIQDRGKDATSTLTPPPAAEGRKSMWVGDSSPHQTKQASRESGLSLKRHSQQEKRESLQQKKRESLQQEKRESLQQEKRESLQQKKRESLQQEKRESLQQGKRESLQQEKRESLQQGKRESLQEKRDSLAKQISLYHQQQQQEEEARNTRETEATSVSYSSLAKHHDREFDAPEGRFSSARSKSVVESPLKSGVDWSAEMHFPNVTDAECSAADISSSEVFPGLSFVRHLTPSNRIILQNVLKAMNAMAKNPNQNLYLVTSCFPHPPSRPSQITDVFQIATKTTQDDDSCHVKFSCSSCHIPSFTDSFSCSETTPARKVCDRNCDDDDDDCEPAIVFKAMQSVSSKVSSGNQALFCPSNDDDCSQSSNQLRETISSEEADYPNCSSRGHAACSKWTSRTHTNNLFSAIKSVSNICDVCRTDHSNSGTATCGYGAVCRPKISPGDGDYAPRAAPSEDESLEMGESACFLACPEIDSGDSSMANEEHASTASDSSDYGY